MSLACSADYAHIHKSELYWVSMETLYAPVFLLDKAMPV